MAKYNFSRIPEKAEEKRALVQNQEFIEIAKKLGITQQDVNERGIPDILNAYKGSNVVPPPPGYSSWNAAKNAVTASGDTYYEEIIREWFDRPLKKEVTSEPPKTKPKKLKKPKQRKRFTSTSRPTKVAGEDISSLFKTVAAFSGIEITPEKLEIPDKEPTTPPISNIIEEVKPKQKTNYPKLPKDLEKSSPKYKAGFDAESLPIYFSNDIDKAAYIISSKSGNKKSKRHDDFVDWAIKVTGWDLRQINILGLEIKSHMKDFYNEAIKEGDFFIQVPDFYTKMKSEIDGIVDDEEEEIPENFDSLLAEIQDDKPKFDFPGYSYSQFLENYPGGTSKKSKTKRTRRSPGQLTKKQEEILHNILQDLIKIKFQLVSIKANQEAKIAYEKKRDRLNAERLAFLEREKEIEALPDKESKSSTVESNKKKEKKSKFLDALKSILISAGVNAVGSTLLSGGDNKSNNNTENKTPPKLAEGGIIGPSGLLPFAGGGSISPVGENSSSNDIQPLGTSPVKSTKNETTYAKGFSIDDLKSPLAEIMKLPLKVAGAALLSAISKMASQFGIDDPKLTSDLSKMINDVSRAFGLNAPTFVSSRTSKLNSDNLSNSDTDQSKLASGINSIADSLRTDTDKKDDPDKKSDSDKKDNTPAPQSSNPPSASSNTSGSQSTQPKTNTQPNNSTTPTEKKEDPLKRAEQLGFISSPNINIASSSMGGSTTNLGIGGDSYSSLSNPSFSSASASFNSTLNNPLYSQNNNFANNFTSFNPGSSKNIFSNRDLNYRTSMNFDIANMSSSGRVPSSYYAYLGLPSNDSYDSIMSPETSSPVVLPTKMINSPQINNIPEGPIRMSKRPSGFNCYATNIPV